MRLHRNLSARELETLRCARGGTSVSQWQQNHQLFQTPESVRLRHFSHFNVPLPLVQPVINARNA
jgi:hypothetical protein